MTMLVVFAAPASGKSTACGILVQAHISMDTVPARIGVFFIVCQFGLIERIVVCLVLIL
jgi:hypothetical protein